MELLNKKKAQFQKSWQALNKSLAQEQNEFINDSIIKRFEFTIEAFWKMLKEHLAINEKLESNYPKGIMRDCKIVNLFNEQETRFAIEMIGDRNLSAHIYNENMSLSLVKKIPKYAKFMEEVFLKI